MSQPVEDDDEPLTIIISRTSTRTVVTFLPIPTTAEENSSSTLTSAKSTKTTDRITSFTSSTTSSKPTESPTETPTDSSSPKPSGGNSALTGPRIAGLVFGILAILALIGGAVFCFRRNRKEKPGRSESEGGRDGGTTAPAAIPLGPVRRNHNEDTDSESDVDIWDNPVPPPQPAAQPDQPRPDLLAPTPRTTAPKTYQPWQSTNPYMVPSRPQTRNENLPPAMSRASSPGHQNHARPSNPRGRPPVPAGYGPHWQPNNTFGTSPVPGARSTAGLSSSENQPVVPVGNNPSWNSGDTFRPRSTDGRNSQDQSLSEGLRIYRS